MINKLEVLYEGKFLRLKSIDGWEVVERKTSTGEIASILAVTKDNEIILVEQYRVPVNKFVIESPAGVIGDHDKNELPLQCAIKELSEETGYISDNWKLAYTSPKSPGMSTETEHKFIAKDCIKVTSGGGVDNEKITVHKVRIDCIVSWLKEKQEQGTLVSSGIYAGLYLYENN